MCIHLYSRETQNRTPAVKPGDSEGRSPVFFLYYDRKLFGFEKRIKFRDFNIIQPPSNPPEFKVAPSNNSNQFGHARMTRTCLSSGPVQREREREVWLTTKK